MSDADGEATPFIQATTSAGGIDLKIENNKDADGNTLPVHNVTDAKIVPAPSQICA